MNQQNLYELSAYSYDLPPHLVARYPLKDRGASKLLVPQAQGILHRSFSQLTQYLRPGDLVLFNDTQVLKSRMFGHKETGGAVEIFVIRMQGHNGTAFIKASKAPKPGSWVYMSPSKSADSAVRVCSQNQDGTYEVNFAGAWLELFQGFGHLPLPPYMNRDAQCSDDERYQTLWAEKPGAVAAPTASLHFSESGLQSLEAAGIQQARLTLHVGAGTFAPVRVDDIREHHMHAEYYEVPASTLEAINETRALGGRIVAIGTTVLRTLETLGQLGLFQGREVTSCTGTKASVSGQTSIFIYPGFEFKVVDLLVTNFHLPESTLLMLVSAFAGKERIDQAYQAAIAHEYRFFSYGDAMLLSREGHW